VATGIREARGKPNDFGRGANSNPYGIKNAARVLLLVLTTATFVKAGEIAVFEEDGAYYVKNLNRNWAVYFDLTWTNKMTGKIQTRWRSLWPLNVDPIGDRKHITRPIPSNESFDPCHRSYQKRGRDIGTPTGKKSDFLVDFTQGGKVFFHVVLESELPNFEGAVND